MKTFRQSFWKATSTSAFLLCAISCAVGIGIVIFSKNLYGEPVWFFLLFVSLFLLLMLFIFINQYFYLIIGDKSLVFQNSIKKSGRHEFLFQNISFIHIEHPGGRSSAYIEIFLKEKNYQPRFTIEAIPESSYATIINLLREKGIEIRTTNLDGILERQAKKR